GKSRSAPERIFRRGGLRCGFRRSRSLRLHYVHPYGKACQNIIKQPKNNQPPGVMNDGATT
ncbi:MAG: hypothetical protein ACK5VX_16550, partial [Akkermansiaceae bacterium]